MHFKKEDIPLLAPDRGGGGMRSIRAGDRNMEIGYSWCKVPIDTGPFYEGLPGNSCNCDHYGYVLSGKFRIFYDDGNVESLEEGDIYFIPNGHHFIYDEPTELIEFNPHDQLQTLMGHFNEELEKVERSGAIEDYSPKR